MSLGIEDRLAILDLTARYNHCIDKGRHEQWADTFTPDGVFESARTGKSVGRDELVAFAQEYTKTRQGIRHTISNQVIDGDGDRATHECYLVLWNFGGEGAPQPVGTADYQDELVKVEGVWRFSNRKVG